MAINKKEFADRMAENGGTTKKAVCEYIIWKKRLISVWAYDTIVDNKSIICLFINFG